MTTNRDDLPHVLEIQLADSPPIVTVWESLRAAEERAKGLEARKEDWIRFRADWRGVRQRVARAYIRGQAIYPAQPHHLTKLDPPPPPTVKPGNGSEATVKQLETVADAADAPQPEAPKGE